MTGTEPVLVLFFTDGGFHTQIPALKRHITEAAFEPVFWQFIGLGDNNFGVLRTLDELPGRVVDNAGFFAVDDIDAMSDSALYSLLLSEFPDWLIAGRRGRVITWLGVWLPAATPVTSVQFRYGKTGNGADC